MNYQHKNLADGRWAELTFAEQMANIGSEVERTINWKNKNNIQYSNMAFERAIELIDLTLDSLKSFPRLKEIARLREAIVGFHLGDNQFKLTEESLKKYFLSFAYAARKDR